MIETKFYSGRLGKHFEGNESEKSVTIIGMNSRFNTFEISNELR